jgi:short-subunit dehydrogenase
MRKQGYGIIINVPSIAGVVEIPAECIDVNTKFALEGLSESILRTSTIWNQSNPY